MAAAASSPYAIEILGLSRRFDAVTALDNVSLSIGRGEYFSLLGPSGCGKTTLLRLLAGLDLPDAGTIRLAGQDSTRVPAHRRPVNTVFQSYALFPHLTVHDNVAFGLRMKRVAPAETQRRVRAVMELAQIADLAGRSPAQLSGGQKQRVALARALVNEPQVLLLDEPLGALDLKLRQELRRELRVLQRRLGITFVHVTHDQDEALALSDRIAVMNAGRVEQCGAPAELYERPRTRFVAQFLGSCNLLPGIVRETGSDGLVVETALGMMTAAWNGGGRRFDPGDACTLTVRPEKLSTRAALGLPAPGELHAGVSEAVYRGASLQLAMEVNGLSLRVEQPVAAGDRPQVGQFRLLAPFPPGTWIVLEDGVSEGRNV